MAEEAKKKEKFCFVIGPIGKEGTPTRIAADWLLNGIIRPVLSDEPFQYVVKRADEFADPGLITDQIIGSVLDADLVIADLTGHNANAFYELAVRHMIVKPTIHMFMSTEELPFDVKDYRAIPYSVMRHSDLEAAKRMLAEQTRAIENPGYEPSNPITKARGHIELKKSGDPKEQLISDLLFRVETMSSRIDELEKEGFAKDRSELERASDGVLQPRRIPHSLMEALTEREKSRFERSHFLTREIVAEALKEFQSQKKDDLDS